MGTAGSLGLEHRLATYGTLAPGRPNEHLLSDLIGTWTLGTVTGHLHERGWGADDGYPGIVLDDSGPQVEVHLFTSEHLPAHWQRLDDFEGPGYRRVPVIVRSDGGKAAAYIYALADHSTLHSDPARQFGYLFDAERCQRLWCTPKLWEDKSISIEAEAHCAADRQRSGT